MTKKLIPILIVFILVIGGGTFYGGMKYGQSKSPAGPLSQTEFQDLRGLSSEERPQKLQELGANVGNFRGGGMRSEGAVEGEITDKGDNSITIKLPDGGSKIIFFSDSTKISKTTEGTIGDLETGKEIMVSGNQGSEGTITAEKIQIITGPVQ